MDNNSSASNSHTFIGAVWCGNEFNDAVPSYAVIRFSDSSTVQIAHARTALTNLQGIGVDEIRVSPIANIEWRQWITQDEVNRIRSGEYSTNIEDADLDDAIQPDETSDLESEASIRGETLCIGTEVNYLFAYMKHSDDDLEVQFIDIGFATNDMQGHNADAAPVMEQFQYRLKPATSSQVGA